MVQDYYKKIVEFSSIFSLFAIKCLTELFVIKTFAKIKRGKVDKS